MVKDIEQKLQRQIDDLRRQLGQNESPGFSVNQRGAFMSRLRLREFTSDPAPASAGEIAYVNGAFRGCTVGGTSPTWVTLG